MYIYIYIHIYIDMCIYLIQCTYVCILPKIYAYAYICFLQITHVKLRFSHCNTLQYSAVHYLALQHTTTRSSISTCCNTLKH